MDALLQPQDDGSLTWLVEDWYQTTKRKSREQSGVDFSAAASQSSSDNNLEEILELGLLDDDTNDFGVTLSFEVDSLSGCDDVEWATRGTKRALCPDEPKVERQDSVGNYQQSQKRCRSQTRSLHKETARERKLRRNRELARESRARKKVRQEKLQTEHKKLSNDVNVLRQKLSLAEKLLKDANMFETYRMLSKTLLCTSIGLLATFASLSVNCMAAGDEIANKLGC